MSERLTEIRQEQETLRRRITELEAEAIFRGLNLWDRVEDRPSDGKPGVGIVGDRAWAPIERSREDALLVLAKEVEHEQLGGRRPPGR